MSVGICSCSPADARNTHAMVTTHVLSTYERPRTYAILRAGTAGPRAWPRLPRCQERNLGLSPGLLGSEAPVAPSMRREGRNQPGRTFPGSLRAAPEMSSALGNRRGRQPLRPRQEAILSQQRRRGATGSVTQWPLSGERETRGLGRERDPDRGALGQVQRKKTGMETER